MNDLNIRPEIKQKVYHMTEQASDPLVQRVARHVFCVNVIPSQVFHGAEYLDCPVLSFEEFKFSSFPLMDFNGYG